MPPLLTVVVISKDDPAGLAGTLRSVECQAFDDLEVIVVAKGSSAGLDAAAFRLAALTLLEQRDGGISAAFNEGIARSRGRWINFLNGGDCYSDAAILQR